MAQGEKQREEMPASPGTCDLPPKSHGFAESSIPARALTSPQRRRDVGALWAVPPCFCGPWGRRCAQAVPGPLRLHGAGECCHVPHFGAVQPCLSHPCARAAPNDQATALRPPFTGFNTHRSTERGFGRCVLTPSLRQWLLPFLGSAKAPLHPGTGAELQHSLDVPVSSPPGCHRMRTLGPEVGESGWR